MPNDINKRYEAKHLANIKSSQNRVKGWYEQIIDQIFEKAGSMMPKEGAFDINDYPVIKTAIDAAMREFHAGVIAVVENGIKDDWELSGLKHIDIVSSTYKGKPLSDGVKRIVYDKQEKALAEFLKQKADGLSLSDRVWKYTNQFQSEIEQGLYAGISEGMSAVRMASEQKKYLQEPDRLFRRVRDVGGKLKLSKAAKAYKPGRGVYRSSFKNALRMTRNQNNFAYRTADHVRWKASPFVLGYEVKLSNNHPRHDVCDRLAGKYPVSFLFKAWHISCICYAVPILASPEEFDAYEDALLAGKEGDFVFSNRISDVPAGYKQWMKEQNADIQSGKVRPLWLKDNQGEGTPDKKGKPASRPNEPNDINERIQYIRENAGSIENAKERAIVNSNTERIGKLNAQAREMLPKFEQFKRQGQIESSRQLIEEYNDLVRQIHALQDENQLYEDRYAERAAELLKAPQPGSAKLMGTKNEQILKGQDLFNKIIGNKRAIEGSRLPVTVKAGRAQYSLNKSIMQVKNGESFKTITHEMGHWLEHKDQEYFEQVKAFYLRRTAGEQAKRLRDIFPKVNYDASEIVKEDKFLNAYTGKIYSYQKADFVNFDSNKQYATEITSMWFTQALSDLKGFIERDPDHFEFIYKLLQK